MSVAGTPTRLPALSPLTPSQKTSHERLLSKIKAGDDEEARVHRKAFVTAQCGKRAMRSGNNALGLMGGTGGAGGGGMGSSSLNLANSPTSFNESFNSPFSNSRTTRSLSNTPQPRTLRSNSAMGGTTPPLPGLSLGNSQQHRRSTTSMGMGSSPAAMNLMNTISSIKSVNANGVVTNQAPAIVGDVGRLIVSASTQGFIPSANNNSNAASHNRRASSNMTSSLQQGGGSPAANASLQALLPNATAITTLDTGIAIALQQSSFEELQQHGVWTVNGMNSCHLPLTTIEAIFKAKIKDSITLRHGAGGGGRATAEAPTSLADNASASERLMRFVEIIAKNCQGIYFDVSGLGLGRSALEVVVDALIKDHSREEEVEQALLQVEEEERRRRAQQQQQLLINVGGGPSPSSAMGDRSGGAGGGKRATFAPGTATIIGTNGGGGKDASNIQPFSREEAYAAHYEFPSYAVVDFSRNFAGEEAGDVIAKLLRENESIVALNLKSMGLVNNPATCGMFYTIAFHNTTLTCLDLSGITGNPRNNLGGESGMAVGEMLKHNEVLTTLRLRDCGLDSSALANIFTNAMTHVALSELDVSGNRLDKQHTCTVLAAMLSYGSCRLEKLVLEGCSIGDGALRFIAKGLNQELHSLSADEATQNESVGLQKYHPYYARYSGGDGATQQHRNSQESGASGNSRQNTPPQLKSSMSNGRVGGKSLPTANPHGFIPAVPASASLKHLLLGNNSFGFVGLMVLSQKLIRMPKLETLSLQDNKLMAQGFDTEGMRQGNTIAAVDALLYVLGESVPTLQELNLSNCALTVMPTRIEFFLTRCLSLARLKLCKNPFGDFGARMLGEAFFQRAYVLKAKYVAASKVSDMVFSGGAVAAATATASGSGAARPSSSSPTGNAAAAAASPRQGSAKASSDNPHNADLHQEPFALLDLTDCGITSKGMTVFLQHLAEAPKVQITNKGLIIGLRAASIHPHEGGATAAGQVDPTPVEGSDATANFLNSGAVPTASTPIGPLLMPPAATSAFASLPTSLPMLPKSLFCAEVIVPSGYHGFAVNSVRLTQPSWAKWNGDLVDLLCHTPCLEWTDLGKYASEALLNGLNEHKKKRIANALPKYHQQLELVKKEENRLFEAKDQIQDEVKRTERAKEAYKSMRDRQKAILTAMKTEISLTTDEIEKQTEVLDGTNNQVNSTEQYYREKNEAMFTELSRFQRKTETVFNMRRDIESQIRQMEIKQKKHNDLLRSVHTQLGNNTLVLRRSSSDDGELATIAQVGGGGGHRNSHSSDASSSAAAAAATRERTASILRQPSIAGVAGIESMPLETSADPTPRPPPPPTFTPAFIATAQSVGVPPMDLQIIALELDLKELEQERDHEQGLADFYKRRLDELNRKVLLLSDAGGNGASPKKKRGGSAKGKAKGDGKKKKEKAVVAKK